MIRHLIVFNIRDGATHEECLAMAEHGRIVLARIPGVLQVSFGVALVQTARYRYNFTIDLENEQAVQQYQVHPLHVAFADEHFRPLAPDRITIDYQLHY